MINNLKNLPEYQAPNEIWTQIEKQLDSKKNNRIINLLGTKPILKLGIAAALALLIFGVWQFKKELIKEDIYTVKKSNAPKESNAPAVLIDKDTIKQTIDSATAMVITKTMERKAAAETGITFIDAIGSDNSTSCFWHYSNGLIENTKRIRGYELNQSLKPQLEIPSKRIREYQVFQCPKPTNDIVFSNDNSQFYHNDYATFFGGEPYPGSNNIKDPIKLGESTSLYYKADSGSFFARLQFDPYKQSSFAPLIENEFLSAKNLPQSTFSIDVDNAAYTMARRALLTDNVMPNKDAVRIEEFVNYFKYPYEIPKKSSDPFLVNTELSNNPWNQGTHLLRIGLKGYELKKEQLPANNLVFLIDVSGSMSDANKLPLVKESLKLLVNQLGENDKISLVVYASASGLVLDATRCSNKEEIISALDRLESGGSTAGGAGMRLAYNIAKKNFINNGNNRIILVTDGDFNVGESTDAAMEALVSEKQKEGIYITACGVGIGNYQDSKMETIADKGNGNYFYIDNLQEANRIFVDGITGTLMTIAKDVKIQIEFNHNIVKAYRLIGYENRKLENKDFTNDSIDAGELGAGHTVTALYEIVYQKSDYVIEGFKEVDSLGTTNFTSNSKDLAQIKLRYKLPKEEKSKELEQSILNTSKNYSETSSSFQFVCGVTCFAQLLRNSKFKGKSTYDLAEKLITESNFLNSTDQKEELLQMVKQAKQLNLVN